MPSKSAALHDLQRELESEQQRELEPQRLRELGPERQVQPQT
jgi:hypothetical protein